MVPFPHGPIHFTSSSTPFLYCIARFCVEICPPRIDSCPDPLREQRQMPGGSSCRDRINRWADCSSAGAERHTMHHLPNVGLVPYSGIHTDIKTHLHMCSQAHTHTHACTLMHAHPEFSLPLSRFGGEGLSFVNCSLANMSKALAIYNFA
jgi:hypothetical protein